MANIRLLGLSGMVGALLIASCSSNESSKSRSGSSGSGTFINLDSGVGAASAIDTPDGLQALTPDQAARLKDPKNACKGWAVEPEGGPAVLEFQVDITNSMSESAPSTGTQSKWQATQTALPQAFANLPPTWAVGLSFFNLPQQGQCYQGRQAVPIAPLTAQQQTALASAVQAQGTAGWTPTEPAYVFALDQIRAYTDSTGANRYIVLVTDGVPTVNSDGCTMGPGPVANVTEQEYQHFINTVATQTAATGVKTFVVGVPGSEDPQGGTYDPMYELSLVAQAGGTTDGCTPVAGTIAGTHSVSPRGTYCHNDMTQTTDFAQGLISTIGTIANSVITCNFTVPAPPAGQVIDPTKVNMVYDDGAGNSYLVLQNTSDTCDRGWHFTDSTNQYIAVCSITCDLLQKNPQASINLSFGCVGNQIPA